MQDYKRNLYSTSIHVPLISGYSHSSFHLGVRQRISGSSLQKLRAFFAEFQRILCRINCFLEFSIVDTSLYCFILCCKLFIIYGCSVENGLHYGIWGFFSCGQYPIFPGIYHRDSSQESMPSGMSWVKPLVFPCVLTIR